MTSDKTPFIRLARRRLGCSQQSLANWLGISRRAIQNYESGEWATPITVRFSLKWLLHESGKTN